MNTAGWITMCLSLAFVVCLTLWSYSKVLRAPAEVADQTKDFHSA